MLLEAFDRADLERLAAVRSRRRATARRVLAGVNCRDLRDLDVRFERFAELAPHLPRHLPTVAESGIGSVDGRRTVAAAGYRLALDRLVADARRGPGRRARRLHRGRPRGRREEALTMFVKICGMNSAEAVEAAVAAGADALGFVFARVAARGDARASQGAVRRACRHTSCASP